MASSHSLLHPSSALHNAFTPVLRVLACLASFFLGPALFASEFDQALFLYKEKRFGEAQPIFEKLDAADPNNPRLVFYLGALALRRGDFEESAKMLERASQLDPRSGHYQNELGDAYGLWAQRAPLLSKLGLAKKCLAAYERAVELDPDNIEYRLSLMTYYVEAPRFAGGNMDKAFEIARDVQRRDSFQGGLTLAGLYCSQKKWAQAFAEIDTLQKKFPDKAEVDYQIGRIAAASGQQLDRGKNALQRYLTTTPQRGQPSLANAHFRLGEIAEKYRDVKGAADAYRQAIRLDPSLYLARRALEKIEKDAGGG
ncbi:MAG TPA: tetratricopeptide repeat protein [Opitutaceae bacterium]|nr:tetratricopeptide repeat protein [Opitutaceae bacterium]